MEEDIQILKEFFEDRWDVKEEKKAIENLIKAYKELEEKYNKALTDLAIEAHRT